MIWIQSTHNYASRHNRDDIKQEGVKILKLWSIKHK